MRVLFYCNTYMQLINSINITIHEYMNEDVDIIVTDYSRNADKVCEKLEKIKIFKNVKYIQIKKLIYNASKKSHIRDFVALFTKNHEFVNEYLWDDMRNYNKIYYYNIDVISYAAYDKSIANGKTTECIRMEESVSSCTDFGLIRGVRFKTLHKLRRLFHQSDLMSATKTYACYNLAVLDIKYRKKGKQIPPLCREDMKMMEILNYIFDYSADEHVYREKYVYFATCMDIDGHNIGEDRIVLKLADIVGKENIIIKQHPKDTRTIYIDNGLHVDKSSFIPWELIQLNHDFKNHVFVSLSSGGILNAISMLKDNIEAYYLYPCVQGKDKFFDELAVNEIKYTLDKLKQAKLCQYVNIIDSVDGLA